MIKASISGADTLVGKLQRGRGQGYLDALAAKRSEAQTALLTCLTSDPRTDPQVENRAEYYGRLAIEVELDLAPLQAFLLHVGQERPAQEDDWRDVLAVSALGWMGRLGRADAVALLRRYVEVGADWESALEAMTYPTLLDINGLETVVAARCESIDELARALPFGDEEPWTGWAKTNARIAEAAAVRKRWREERAHKRDDLGRLSTLELLRGRELSALRGRASDADKATLLAAAAGEDARMRHDAIKALGWQRDLRVLDAAEAELRRFPDRDSPPNAGWFAVSHLLKDSPIPRAREWVGQRGRLAELALHAVAAWPEPGDAALLTTTADRFGEEDWLYRSCDAVEGLARLQNREAVPLLERIFRETTYSYLRARVARALASLSSTFSEGFGVECLWDCEEGTVMVGCASATLASAAVRNRLPLLASDRLRDRRIRALAARRTRAVEQRP